MWFYGAFLAFGQADFKRLVAYSSVSHMGFVLLGLYAWNSLAVQGAIMQMVAHGVSTAALFMMAGALQQRLHTRDMDRMGGLWQNMPRMGACAMFFALASLGLPGLGNFVAEFLVLVGLFQVSPLFTLIAALGLGHRRRLLAGHDATYLPRASRMSSGNSRISAAVKWRR